MNSIRRISIAVTIIVFAGCAGGPGPDLSGPEGPRIMDAYSGEWTLLRLDSDNLSQELRGAMATPGSGAMGMPGQRPGGRRPGGMTGGRGGMRGGAPGGMDPEAMQAAMATVRALSSTPESMSLTLRPTRVTLAPLDQAVLTMELGAEEAVFTQGDLEFFARARWMKTGLVVEKEVDEGFAVADKIFLDDEGRLLVERTIHLMGRAVEGTLVYRREGG